MPTFAGFTPTALLLIEIAQHTGVRESSSDVPRIILYRPLGGSAFAEKEKPAAPKMTGTAGVLTVTGESGKRISLRAATKSPAVQSADRRADVKATAPPELEHGPCDMLCRERASDNLDSFHSIPFPRAAG